MYIQLVFKTTEVDNNMLLPYHIRARHKARTRRSPTRAERVTKAKCPLGTWWRKTCVPDTTCSPSLLSPTPPLAALQVKLLTAGTDKTLAEEFTFFTALKHSGHTCLEILCQSPKKRTKLVLERSRLSL